MWLPPATAMASSFLGMRNRSGHCRHGTPCCNGLICSAPSSLNRKYSGTLNREHLFGRSEDDGSCRGVGQMSDRRTVAFICTFLLHLGALSQSRRPVCQPIAFFARLCIYVLLSCYVYIILFVFRVVMKSYYYSFVAAHICAL
ncbi:hypothetical protein V3C99_014552 [Haemonchus contortus]